MFHQTKILSLISAQKNGMVLHVEGFSGHMAGDLKTLKCMYNISKGAVATSPCLYCMSKANTLNNAN